MWESKGLIYNTPGELEWSKSHAQVPFPLKISESTTRIYFATRDDKSRSSINFIDVESSNPSNILYKSQEPVLSPGENPGSFDRDGTMPSWIVEKDNKKYLFYTGWNKDSEMAYRLSIGLAIDSGSGFQKAHSGPILERNQFDPYWVGQPSVMYKDGRWHMWYLSCQDIRIINNRPEPMYLIKYMKSKNPSLWDPSKAKTAIAFDSFADAIARPAVYSEGDKLIMFYSYRSATDYRTNPDKAYRLGYAECTGNNFGLWKRKDIFMDHLNNNREGWNKDMIEYCSMYLHDQKKYLLYNGNGFGSSGFGYAIHRE